ncbi:MAG: 4-(cytidine 5'-diphospho)-2-C-methyl-D-erythritol kinase [Treponema sp.]|jgi:4-diphosphocytidyl-2-C-methyl-D-erythritol kinase|nr:4-(cytidine 5'-diphospho)-2-C-methyl-D-erythritol kinase [Treponema sp.]
MIVYAPAKVNLHLAVLDKRQDGFHNLESLFVTLNFSDILHFEPFEAEIEGKMLELVMEGTQGGLDLPMEKNIIYKALSLFKKKSLSLGKGDFNIGLRIRVEKRIPAGGGLGGGSSNAASTLLTLNSLAGSIYGETPFDRSELLEMAACLGSDVPFFIHQVPAAWVTGRGEYIDPLKPPSWHFVLVNPGFQSDTAAAFKLLDESRAGNPEEAERVKQEYRERMLLGFYNDFLKVFPESQKSIYNKIISQLWDCGAEFANLSGAGSTCFGVFNEPEKAEKAALSLQKEWDFVHPCSVNFPK